MASSLLQYVRSTFDEVVKSMPQGVTHNLVDRFYFFSHEKNFCDAVNRYEDHVKDELYEQKVPGSYGQLLIDRLNFTIIDRCTPIKKPSVNFEFEYNIEKHSKLFNMAVDYIVDEVKRAIVTITNINTGNPSYAHEKLTLRHEYLLRLILIFTYRFAQIQADLEVMDRLLIQVKYVMRGQRFRSRFPIPVIKPLDRMNIPKDLSMQMISNPDELKTNISNVIEMRMNPQNTWLNLRKTHKEDSSKTIIVESFKIATSSKTTLDALLFCAIYTGRFQHLDTAIDNYAESFLPIQLPRLAFVKTILRYYRRPSFERLNLIKIVELADAALDSLRIKNYGKFYRSSFTNLLVLMGQPMYLCKLAGRLAHQSLMQGFSAAFQLLTIVNRGTA